MALTRVGACSAVFLSVLLLAQPVTAQPVNPQAGDPTVKAPARPQYKDALRLVDAWLDAVRDYDRLAGLSAAPCATFPATASGAFATTEASRAPSSSCATPAAR